MRRGLLGLAAVCAAALVATLAGAATLPGGTPITVSITAPGDNVTLPAAPFTVQGTASVGVGAAVADTTLIYVLDVSGSTSAATGTLGRCPRQNVYDTSQDTTLDCELLAVRDLNQAAIATGTVAKIGLIAFAGVTTGGETTTNILSAAALDLSPVSGPAATLAAPNANDFTPAVSGTTTVFTPSTNLDWVVQSAYLGGAPLTPGLVGWPARGPADGFTLFTAHDVGTGTNYTAALYALKNLLASVTTPKKVVAFLSDGAPNLTISGQPLSTPLGLLPGPATGLKIYTFAIGGAATCGTDPPATLDGSLLQISNHYGTTCELRPDPSDAADIVPSVIASQLTSVGLTVDGVAQSGVTITPVLPVTGPNSVSFTKSLNLPASLTPYTICATASGHDGAGIGNADPSCIHVTIQAPPTVTIDGDGTDGTVGSVPEGSPFSIGGTVTGIGTTTTWSYSGGTGTCSFGDGSAVNTTVTCTDDGTYALTLTADDGINPPVSATEHLLVTNVAPTPTLTLTPTHLPLSSGVVAAHIAIADPGSDTFDCSIDWGDSTTDVLPAAGTTCDATHQYLAAGTFTVHVTVNDDDHGVGSTSGDVTVKGAPTITLAGDGEVNEGTAFAIPASVDGAQSVAWTASGGTGTCTFTPSDAASTSVTCNDNGLYALTLSAVDEFGQTSSATVHLLVDNVAPTLIVTNPVAGASPRSVIFNGIVTDPGSNDVLTCHIDWGDGHNESVPVTGGFCNATHTYDASLAGATIHTTASDDDGGVSAERIIPLTFNRPPICLAVRASDGSLWPPNHQMVLIQLSGATDPDTGDSVSYAITSVRQDEPLLGGGSGNFSPDAQRASGGGVYLRSERDGTGDGRVYTITYTVTDTQGAGCTGTVTVGVPHDQAHDAQLTPGVSYNSFG